MVCWRHLLTLTSEGSPPCAKLVRWGLKHGEQFALCQHELLNDSMNMQTTDLLIHEALIYFDIMIP